MTTNLESIKKTIKKTKPYELIATNLNYKNPIGYTSTQNIAVNLAAQVFITEQHLKAGLSKELIYTVESPPTKAFLYAAQQVAREIIPCYWVASELSESLLATDVPEDWTDLQLFINKGFLLFPKNFIKYSGFKETESIDWVYFETIDSISSNNIYKILNSNGNEIKSQSAIL